MLDGHKIALNFTRLGKIIEVVSVASDLRHIVQSFELVQQQRGLVHTKELKRSIWRTLLYHVVRNYMSDDQIDAALEEALRSSPPRTGLSSGCTRLNTSTQGKPLLFDQLLWNKSPRSLFLIDDRFVRGGPPGTQVGDVVHATRTLAVPVLLRSDEACKEQDQWRLFGITYVVELTYFPEYRPTHLCMDRHWGTKPEVQEIVII